MKITAGDSGKMRIVVDNAYLDIRYTRASLGLGVKVKVLQVERDPKQTRSYVTLAYEVKEEATNGYRDLTIQANRMKVVEKNSLYISGGKYVLEPEPKLEIEQRSIITEPVLKLEPTLKLKSTLTLEPISSSKTLTLRR